MTETDTDTKIETKNNEKRHIINNTKEEGPY